jgi:RimJ/RimL family protein N-acetyltransferase
MFEELQSERLTIRNLVADDLLVCHQLRVEVGWTDPEASEAENLAQQQRWLDWTIRNNEQLAALCQPPYGEKGVVEKRSGLLIGLIGLVPLLAPFEQLPAFGAKSAAPYSAEVGLFWALRPAFQGQGFATEAARALIQFAFGSLRIGRILASTEYDNSRSLGVMKRLGMQIERNPEAEPHWFQITGILRAS